MNLSQISDQSLLNETKRLTQCERKITTQILHHLSEVERRRLYSDCGCSSLFDYAVKELKYSEGQAGRRIRAMRLIKDVPEVEAKLKSGTLSLTNAAQAQSFLRELSKGDTTQRSAPTRSEKLAMIEKLENKSTREAQRTLFAIQPDAAVPKKDRERVVGTDKTQVSFVMDDELKAQLEQVRSLAGPKAVSISYNELFKLMAQLSVEGLKAKRFGKKRSKENSVETKKIQSTETGPEVVANPAGTVDQQSNSVKRPAVTHGNQAPSPPKSMSRYISRQLKHLVWQRDEGRCRKCLSQRNLNYDHIEPVALGGSSNFENIRLLCASCNQRAAMKVFGVDKMIEESAPTR